jgi:hypothetical protein
MIRVRYDPCLLNCFLISSLLPHQYRFTACTTVYLVSSLSYLSLLSSLFHACALCGISRSIVHSLVTFFLLVCICTIHSFPSTCTLRRTFLVHLTRLSPFLLPSNHIQLLIFGVWILVLYYTASNINTSSLRHSWLLLQVIFSLILPSSSSTLIFLCHPTRDYLCHYCSRTRRH